MGKRTDRREKLQKERQRKRLISIAIIAAGVLLIGFVVASTFLSKPKSNSAIIMPAVHDRPTLSENSMGDPDAPVVVEEFSNYHCSHCMNFALNIEPQFIEDYVATGKVYFKYIPYAWTDIAIYANEATFCAMDQGMFWEYRDIVYANVDNEAIGGITENNLIAFASALGLEEGTFSDCLTNRKSAQTVQEIAQYAEEVGIEGTPTFKVNDRLVYLNDLYDTIDTELAKNQ